MVRTYTVPLAVAMAGLASVGILVNMAVEGGLAVKAGKGVKAGRAVSVLATIVERRLSLGSVSVGTQAETIRSSEIRSNIIVFFIGFLV